MRRLVAVVVLAVVVLSGLLGWRVVSDKLALLGPAGGSGVIEGTTVRLSSRVGGRIAELPVREGQPVVAGDVVVRLDCVEPDAALAAAEAQLAAAEQAAAAAERVAVAARTAAQGASAVAAAADAQARAVAIQGAAADRQAGRLDAVEGDVSVAQRDQARAGAQGLQAQAEAAAAQRRAGQAQATAAESQAEAAEAQAAAAREQVAAARANRERAAVAQADCTLTAPRAGVVQLLPFEVGELTGPGAQLATVVDVTTAKATFYLPNADLASARPGGRAEVRADAWPDQVFVGVVTTVATEAEFTPRNIQTRTDRDRLVYKVEVAVENPEGALRPGMPVEVRLLGEEQG